MALQAYHLHGYAKLYASDPTHTTTLRNAFETDMRKRFAIIRGVIRKAIVDQDCFGLKEEAIPLLAYAASDVYLPGKKAFAFSRSSQKMAGFMDWFDDLQKRELLEVSTFQQVGSSIDRAWTNRYITDSYSRGVQRARYELKKAGERIPSIEETGGIATLIQSPLHMERVGVLYTRAFEELRGISTTMGTQISRVLSQGMIDGKNPADLAKILTRTISGPVGDLGITDTLGRFIPAERRAMTLARTEVIRAHHMGNIQELRNWGVAGVKVQAEWITAGDSRVCPECLDMAMRSTPYTLDGIEGMIPYHSNCRCCAIPVIGKAGEEEGGVGEVGKAFNDYVDRGGTTYDKIPSDFVERIGSEKISKEQLMESKLCYSNSLLKAQEEGYELWVGQFMDEEVVKRLLSKDPKYINFSYHAWNVKNGKLFDFTLGYEKGAYIGKKISIKGLKNGKDVRNKLFDLLEKAKLPGLGKPLSWKPAMTREEAKIWIKDSKMKESWFHGTNVGEKIKEVGFKVEGTAKTGRFVGDGVYMAHENVAKTYGKDLLELKVNIKNTFDYRKIAYVEGNPNQQASNAFVLKQARWLIKNNLSFGDASKALSEFLKSEGFDSLIYEESKGSLVYVVFDVKNVTVIK